MLSDIDKARGEQVAETLREMDQQAHFIAANVAEEDSVKWLLSEIKARFGRLDYAFNNAGIEELQGKTAECIAENWHKTIAVNLSGVFHCMK